MKSVVLPRLVDGSPHPMTTPFHAKYLAHELTKRLPAEKAEKLSQFLVNAESSGQNGAWIPFRHAKSRR